MSKAAQRRKNEFYRGFRDGKIGAKRHCHVPQFYEDYMEGYKDGQVVWKENNPKPRIGDKLAETALKVGGNVVQMFKKVVK